MAEGLDLWPTIHPAGGLPADARHATQLIARGAFGICAWSGAWSRWPRTAAHLPLLLLSPVTPPPENEHTEEQHEPGDDDPAHNLHSYPTTSLPEVLPSYRHPGMTTNRPQRMTPNPTAPRPFMETSLSRSAPSEKHADRPLAGRVENNPESTLVAGPSGRGVFMVLITGALRRPEVKA